MAASKLDRIIEALRKAEDIEIYLLIGAVVVTLGLEFFHIIPESLLPELTLGVLVLLAVAMLRLRRHTEDLLVRVTKVSQFIFHEGPAHDIRADFRTGRNVLVSGSALTRTLRNHLSDMGHLVTSGGTLRVLLLDPDSPFAGAAAMRSSQKGYRFHQASFIGSSLRDLETLMSLPGGSVEIRLSEYPFSMGAILVDPGTPNASIHLRYYTYRPTEGEGPYFNLYPSDRPWYEHFRAELEAIWSDAKAYQPGR